MDDHRFDALTRRFARRGALKGGAGVALGALAAALGLENAAAAKRRAPGNGCRTNADCASGRCVAESRLRKVCGCPDPAQSPCDGECVDLKTTSISCGTCGHVCPNCALAAGDSRSGDCRGGVCAAPAALLGRHPGLRICDQVCVDVLGDKHNCGVCGHRCPVGNTQGCVDGQCQACPKGQIVCPGFPDCHDLLSDPNHCNGCGRSCARGQSCVGGVCQCPTDRPLCTVGDAAYCADVLTDDFNCGACGVQCNASFGEVCQAGHCVCADPLSTHCGDTCVDLQTTNFACGACGHVCPDCQAATGLGRVCDCSAGQCVVPAIMLGLFPGLRICGDVCIDIQADPANCGACGHACQSGAPCAAGHCGCPSGQRSCGDGCCPDGRSCCEHVCCGAGGLCCSAAIQASGSSGGGPPPPACVDAQTDPANCGACGAVCGHRQQCLGGLCQSLPCLGLGEAAALAGDCCSGALGGHPDSGQFCACAAGATCPGPRDPATGSHPSARCCADGTFCAEDASGGAGAPACCAASGRSNCGTATCLDLQNDPAHCGVCGTSCPSGTCAGGVCPCPNGQADCPAGDTCITSATLGPICVFAS